MTPQNNSHYEIVGAAASEIARDLNNQLTLIVNHLAGRDIAGALEAVERCSVITAGLSQVSRAGTLTLETVDPVSLVRDFAARLRLPEGIRLFLSIPAPVPAITANPDAVMKVLTSLVLNACQAMEHGGVLRLSVVPGCIEVADSGSGIDARLAERIFEPFFTTRGDLGYGLGLTMVRDLMRQQAGSVTFHQEAGRGARFTLHFRAAKPQPQGKTLKGSPRKIAPAA